MCMLEVGVAVAYFRKIPTRGDVLGLQKLDPRSTKAEGSLCRTAPDKASLYQ